MSNLCILITVLLVFGLFVGRASSFIEHDATYDTPTFGVWAYPNFRGKCKNWKTFASIRPLQGCISLNMSNVLRQYDEPWEMVESFKLFRFHLENSNLYMLGYDSVEECEKDPLKENYKTTFRQGVVNKCVTTYRWQKLWITLFRVQNRLLELTGWESKAVFDDLFDTDPENYVTVQYTTGQNCKGEVILTEAFRADSAIVDFFFEDLDEFCGKKLPGGGGHEFNGKCLWNERGVSARFWCKEKPPLEYLLKLDPKSKNKEEEEVRQERKEFFHEINKDLREDYDEDESILFFPVLLMILFALIVVFTCGIIFGVMIMLFVFLFKDFSGGKEITTIHPRTEEEEEEETTEIESEMDDDISNELDDNGISSFFESTDLSSVSSDGN